MKWIFAFHQGGNPRFDELIRVAVASARRHTILEAHCLYEGEETALTAWLRTQGVQVWPTRSRYWEVFAARARQLRAESDGANEGGWLRVAPGAFLRMEVAAFCQQQGWSDEFVLYTDVDIVFLRDPQSNLAAIRPSFFAVAPEAWRDNRLHMNSGVMLWNMPAMQKIDARFENFVRARLKKIMARDWDKMPYRERLDIYDQGAYRTFFNPLHLALYHLGITDRLAYKLFLRPPLCRPQWDDLPLELNWKPYWGANEQASILHFHGPKPYDLAVLRAQGAHTTQTHLYNPSFEAWCAVWEREHALLDPL